MIPIHTQHYRMLQRNLLYTAITRGRELVVLVGGARALSLAVKRREARGRYSALAGRLKLELESGPPYGAALFHNDGET